MDNIDLTRAVTQNFFRNNNVTADFLRLDLIHNIVSGNKYFKLKYNFQKALELGYKKVLTFGGAFSNHIVSTAYFSKINNIQSIGVIRGEKPKEISKTLSDSLSYGIELFFVSRNDFKNRYSDDFQENLKNNFGNFYLVPEGGDSELGRIGAKEILPLTDFKKYTHIICAIGTGTMFFGIANSSDLEQKIIGIPVLKGFEDFLENNKNKLENISKFKNCQIINDYHFNGYAKKNSILIEFMNDFYNKNKIPTDFVYTAKMTYAFFDLLKKDFFPSNSNILLIHSGGLQGNNLIQKDLIF